MEWMKGVTVTGFGFGLQRFAENQDGSEEDDPNVPDDDENLDNEDDEGEGGEVDLAALKRQAGAKPSNDDEADEEDSQEEADSEADDQAGKQDGKPADKTEKPARVEIPPELQPEVDRLIQDRLARDRRVQSEAIKKATEEQINATLRANYGLDLAGVQTLLDQKRIEEIQYEHGWDEQKAKEALDREKELARLRAREQEIEAREKATVLIRQYETDKAKYSSDANTQKYMTEIDEFSQGGTMVPFEAARNFVLGAHMQEILQATARAGEQRVLASQARQQAKAPAQVKPAGGSGQSESFGLTPDEISIAKRLGLKPADYAKEKAKITKERRR